MSGLSTQVLRAAATIVGLTTCSGALTSGVAVAAPADQPQAGHSRAAFDFLGHDAARRSWDQGAGGAASDTERFEVPRLSASRPQPGSDLGFGTDYRGPHDDGFDDDATRKDYGNRHGPTHRRGCADSDDPQNYNDCSVHDFRTGGPRDGDGYDNSNRRLEDDDVPPEAQPRSLFTNKKRDEGRRLSPPGSFFQ